ncbi:extracellular signal-regulated kinase 2-like [Oscarella lobularis]|uniref:extracellular signal-regulated kinase 2-like n=1 Tax=Oscarella lobularis TaxID=121494 RepID=UPI0033132821
MSTDIDSHVTSRYQIQKRVGKGAYGIVWKAIDKKTGEIVALKKIFDAFQNETDAQRTYREIMFLQEFGHHENVVKLLNVIRADNDKDIYLVFEYMDTDLHAVIKANILKAVHKQYIMYQLLKAIRFIHSGNVVHRDQKPSNILLNSDCFIKVADFGLARSVSRFHYSSHSSSIEGINPAMTDYVATRWYRAPEILLGSHRYTKGVDMWSLGCILGELLLGKPLFPGTSSFSQINLIMEALPPPTREDIESMKAPYAQQTLSQIRHRRRRSLHDIFSSSSPDALDLLSRLLHFNPNKRLTAEQALTHPYVAKFHQPENEPVLRRDVVLRLDDNDHLSIEEYRKQLYKDIAERRKELRERREESIKVEEKREETKEAAATTEEIAKEKSPNPPAEEASAVLFQRRLPHPRSHDNDDDNPFVSSSSSQKPPIGRHHPRSSSLKATGPVITRSQDKDLAVVSARIIPQRRPESARDVARRAAMQQPGPPSHAQRRPYGSGGANAGGPPRPLYGKATHTFATVSKSSLEALRDRRW